jgi:starch phosphorylase
MRLGGYDPMRVYAGDAVMRGALDAIAGGVFSPQDPSRHQSLVNALLWGGDHYLLLADFADYVIAQSQVDARFRDREAWVRSAIANVAGMGAFSSDRSIREYAERIWRVAPSR